MAHGNWKHSGWRQNRSTGIPVVPILFGLMLCTALLGLLFG